MQFFPARHLALAAALAVTPAAAQSLTILPEAPSYLEPVYVRVSPEAKAEYAIIGARASMSGSTITVDLETRRECCGQYHDVMLGRFPAGTYAVRILFPNQVTTAVQFTVGAPARAKAAPATVPAVNYTDLWWSPSESGWGLAVYQGPFNDVFATWFVYGIDGLPSWYLLGSGKWTRSGAFTRYEGKVFKTRGPHFSQLFDPTKVGAEPVGTATLQFRDSMTGTLQFDVEGVSGMKSITRMPVE